jgi:hypothetical protein
MTTPPRKTVDPTSRSAKDDRSGAANGGRTGVAAIAAAANGARCGRMSEAFSRTRSTIATDPTSTPERSW